MAVCDEVRDRLGFVSWSGYNPGSDLGAMRLGASVLALKLLPPCSLHSNSPLDVSIKGQMIRDLLNLAGFVLPSTDSMASRPQTRSGSTCRSDPFSVRAAGQGRVFFLWDFIWGLFAAQRTLVSVLLRACACWSFSYGSEGLASLLGYLVPAVSSRQKDLCPLCGSIVGSEASVICACSAVSRVVLSLPSPCQN